MTLDEHKRELRVIDQCISMHWSIAEKNKRRALLLSICLILSSATLCGLTFADDATLSFFGVSPQKGRITVGLASIIVFALSIVELRVNWSGTARLHEDAARRLSRLKAKYRRVRELPPGAEQEVWKNLSAEYISTFEELPDIPNSQFAGLKAKHLFKVELSKELDKHPRVPAIVLACKLRILGIHGMIRTTTCSASDEPTKDR